MAIDSPLEPESPSGRLTPVALIGGGVTDDPDSDAAVERRVLTIASQTIFVGAVIWGLLYVGFDEPWAGAVPLSYAVITAITLTIARRTDTWGWYREMQFALIVLLPFLLMVILGGFVDGSAVIIWALLSPFGALLSTKPRQAVFWFASYGILTVSAVILGDIRTAPTNLPVVIRNGLFVANLVAPAGIAFLVVREFVAQRDRARAALRVEQEKSESLLLNVLPEEVAGQLKDNRDAIAEHYDSVSVLFADIVGFTPISASMSPDRLVHTLNDVFSHFDEIAQEHGVEKIRTIGDNYMVAAGLPSRRADHAECLADMAIAMRDYQQKSDKGHPPFVFRIGINSGPLVAGVIGTSRFQYDIWGDTVNVASRMESHGIPGEIQVSTATKELLGDSFELRRRGMIEVKGKDSMETWILEGRQP